MIGDGESCMSNAGVLDTLVLIYVEAWTLPTHGLIWTHRDLRRWPTGPVRHRDSTRADGV